MPNLTRPCLTLYNLRRFKIRQESRRKTIREGATLYRQSPSLLRAQNEKANTNPKLVLPSDRTRSRQEAERLSCIHTITRHNEP